MITLSLRRMMQGLCATGAIGSVAGCQSPLGTAMNSDQPFFQRHNVPIGIHVYTLGDLPRKQRDELLEDLQQHLAEVGAEGEGSLTDQLGPPEAYAAELRSAARLRPSGPTGRTYDDRIIAAWKRAGSFTPMFE